MVKTMTRFFAILAALTCVASAQTYRTVTADTNNVIRTNFTLGAAQISGSFAISNVTGLQSALDGKLATNGNAAALTNFPALLLATNSSESVFPSALLRTNGDGSGLTNLPNADLGSATGILPLANGGTGATNANGARTALELGTAATNDATVFQPANTNLTALASGDGSSLTNVTITDASTLTNFPAELLRTNGDAAGLTNFPSELLRTNGDGSGLSNVSVDLTTVLPAYSNNAAKVLAVASGETNVEWIAVSNTVTDASTLTNFPASILQTTSADGSFPAFLLRTNGSAAGLTSFPASLLTTNGDASGLTNFPTLNQNTTGTASNVTGVVAIANGGSGQTTAAAAIEAFLPAYSGNADKILALNSNATGLVWTTNAGGGSATVDLASTNATGVLPVAKGGTGTNSAAGALVSLGLYTSTLTNHAIRIGVGSTTTGSGIAIGQGASSRTGIAIGLGSTINSNTTTHYPLVIGENATNGALATNGIAIGRLARTGTNTLRAAAFGVEALAAANDSIQLGTGTNSTAESVQFLSAGSVDTNEWARIAALSTYPTTNISVVGTNNTNTLVFSNGILVEVQ